MLVSCLLTFATCAWSGLASQQQIPLANSHQQPAVDAHNSRKSSNNKNGTTISSELFAELEELARVVDITYCVGSVGAGIEPPFTCPSRCGDFPSFELVTVCPNPVADITRGTLLTHAGLLDRIHNVRLLWFRRSLAFASA